MRVEQIFDGALWTELLKRFSDADVYHTFEYSSIAASEDSTPSLLHCQTGNAEFIMPILVRKIECDAFSKSSLTDDRQALVSKSQDSQTQDAQTQDAQTQDAQTQDAQTQDAQTQDAQTNEIVSAAQDVKDIGSVYGYPGPLFLGDWNEVDLKAAWASVTALMIEQNVVTLVCRLNPFVRSGSLLSMIGECRPINPIIAIDLTLSEEEQVKQYRSNHRRDIKKLIKAGIVCKEVSADEHLGSFRSMYAETMQRLGAADEYFFDSDYFNRLFRSEEFKVALLMCFSEDNEAICGGIFFTKGKTLHYHLGATASDHLRLAPTKLLFHVAREYGMSIGCDYLNLGGGLGGQEDSLYNFKAGFSKLSFDYSIFTAVFNQAVYNQLSDAHVANVEKVKSEIDKSYFPLYRAPVSSDWSI